MGQFSSILTQSFPPSPTWSIDDIPDLTGKVVLVTGGNSGIGKVTVKALLGRNAKVYLAARNSEKTTEALEEIQRETGKKAHLLVVDLSSLNSVRAAATQFQQNEDQLHILFNNGGVLTYDKNAITTDGYDLQFGTNVLSHFYLTKLLLPTLRSTAQTTEGGKVRVLTASSLMHIGSKLDFNSLRDGPAKRRASGATMYGQSKLGSLLFGLELARQYGEEGVVSITLNPGNFKSDLVRPLSYIERKILSLFLYPTHYGALTQLWGATSPEGANLNGRYLIPWARVGGPPGAEDHLLQKQLWEWMEEQISFFERADPL